MPEIDVLIPVFNAASTIESALQSICDQTFRDIRIIVVDDGSTDETPAILSRMAQRDDRIEVITIANGGIVDALNRGLLASSAPFIARHDADDLAFPHRLETQLAYLEAATDCVAVGANAFHIDVHGTRTGYLTEFQELVVGDSSSFPSREPYLLHPFLLARREAVVAIGGYRYLFHSEDTDLYWRLAVTGRLSNVVEPLGEYRVHADSISSTSVLNGRISAVSSQLAAVSEGRRRSGRADLILAKADLDRYREAGSLDRILDAACGQLGEDERVYLRIATAAKLLELSSYRPYRMTPEDVTTIRDTLAKYYDVMPKKDRLRIVFRLILARKRVARNWKEAVRLVPWRIMPTAIVEMIGFMPSVIGKKLRTASVP